MARQRFVFRNLDWFTLVLYIALMLMGWFNIYSASYNPEFPSIFDNSQEYGKQFVWIITALILGSAVLLLDGDFIRRSAPAVYIVTVLLLVLVLIFGKEVNGAKAWFRFGSIGIQPSEFSKFAISLALAAYLGKTSQRFQGIQTKLVIGLIILFPALLIMLQPDTGTVLVYSAFVLVLYREGLSGNILLFGIIAAA